MKKKIVTVIILAVSAVMSCLPVCAQEYTANGTGECKVSATVSSSYSVQVPAVLELQYDSVSGKYEAAYTVSAKGNILPSQSVTVRPTGDSFTLTGTLTGETSQAAITQEITEWIHTSKLAGSTGKLQISDAEYTEAEGKVSAELARADTYTGEFTFAFALGDYTE